MGTLLDAVPLYADLFVGRHDDHAVQLSSGRYRRVGQPLTPIMIADHLLGVRTYGTYVRDTDGRCRFAVIDADTDDGLGRLWALHEELAAQGIASYLEASRRGGHLWIFFTVPTPASAVRSWLLPSCPSDFEFYPKQDEGRGVGSLIRLPFGVHRRSGKRYPFVERTSEGLTPVAPTVEASLAWLSSIRRVEVPTLKPEEKRSTHTSFSSLMTLPILSDMPLTIRDWNAQQDPFITIGRYVELDHAGLGHCPFHWHHKAGHDRHPSFKVYTPGSLGGYCWYCYTWGQGGSVFDFFRYYYRLDASTLWARLQQGAALI